MAFSTSFNPPAGLRPGELEFLETVAGELASASKMLASTAVH
jgi:hypothetical protein